MTFTTSGNLLGAAPVAQLVEQRTFNPRVLRSIRSGGTDFPLWRLPSNMQAKIQLELCPQPELPGFCWGWTGALNSKGYSSLTCVGFSTFATPVMSRRAWPTTRRVSIRSTPLAAASR